MEEGLAGGKSAHRSAWGVALTYSGTIVGAGFASGQELAQFFGRYGWTGLLGTVLAGALFAVLGYLSFEMGRNLGSVSYRQVLLRLAGPVGRILDGLTWVFLLASLAVMLAGARAVFTQHWHVPDHWGILAVAVAAILAVAWGNRGLVRFNTYLVPALIAIMMGLALVALVSRAADLTEPMLECPGLEVLAACNPISLIGNNWILATCLYVAYNMIIGFAVLASLGGQMPAAAGRGTVWGGMIIGGLAMVATAAILLAGEPALNSEIPLLTALGHTERYWQHLYAMSLLVALLTTAAGDAYGLIARMQEYLAWPVGACLALILVLVVPISNFSFSWLVGVAYPLGGYLGLALMASVVFQSIRGLVLPRRRL